MFKDLIYITGGLINNEAVKCVEAYNPMTKESHNLTDMEEARCGHGIVEYNDCVYVVGGFNSKIGGKYSFTIII